MMVESYDVTFIAGNAVAACRVNIVKSGASYQERKQREGVLHLSMKQWWQQYRPGEVERVLAQSEQQKEDEQNAHIGQYFQQEAERHRAENIRQAKEAEAMRAKYEERRRGGKLAWAARIRETPQMREIRLAAEAESAKNAK